MSGQIESIYSGLSLLDIVNNPNALQSVQTQVFFLLINGVKRWSSYNDIAVDDQHVVRITLTYLSPELLHLIILNNQLAFHPGASMEQFQKNLSGEMEPIADRNELIFLITITSSISEQSLLEEKMTTLAIPVNKIMLINAANQQIPISHSDPPLNQEIIISRGHLSGYIAYPIWVEAGENCVNVMDSHWNTTMTVSATGVKVAGIEYMHQLIWSVKYIPLVDMEISANVQSPPTVFPTDIAPSKQPPMPAQNVLVTQEDDEYWAKMARYIWGYVTDP